MAVAFKAHCLIPLHNTLCLLRQPVRNRYVPDPGTLEQRLFRAVTTPVLPPVHINPVDKRIRNQERLRLQHENNPYREFLRQKAREEFYELANDRMLLVLFPLYHKPRELLPVKNKLFRKNLVFHSFPVSILRETAVGTRWEVFTKCFLTDSSPNLYLFGDADPDLCGAALNILKKAPFLLLQEQLAYHESEALNVLAQSDRVRICIEPHQSELRRLTGAQADDSSVEVSSLVLKKIIKQLKSSVSLIKTDGNLPLFKLCDKVQNPAHGNKTGIKLNRGERGKTLKMNSQIDDHMLGVRVKQAETLLDSDYVVTVFVKLPQSKSSGCEKEIQKEQENLAKTMYKIQAQRFVNAFSEIPSATVRLLERPQMTEIVIFVRRTKSS
ncbi:Mitochondrial ribosomal protein l10 [Fasciola gigantica]|uniref:Mitochondrial ribosomal protein l10 n=1 Tax=Fasciola gigantica TaxID=46835 RepID=A0A504YQ94_FASGI|nr:Mitochondrial ribosomal protein l10 [Fasciola gigantica]